MKSMDKHTFQLFKRGYRKLLLKNTHAVMLLLFGLHYSYPTGGPEATSGSQGVNSCICQFSCWGLPTSLLQLLLYVSESGAACQEGTWWPQGICVRVHGGEGREWEAASSAWLLRTWTALVYINPQQYKATDQWFSTRMWWHPRVLWEP